MKYILIIIIVIILSRYIFRLAFPFILRFIARRMFRKMDSQFGDQFKSEDQTFSQGKEGEIKVDYIPPKKENKGEPTSQRPKRTIKID